MIHQIIASLRWSICRAVAVCASLLAVAVSSIAAQGPGLGNFSYSGSELFTQVSSPLIDDTTGFLPPDYPNRKHFGVNVMTMLNGYMLGVFAPDSGKGPGGWIAVDVSNPKSMQLVNQVYEPDATNVNRTGDGLRTSEFREPHSFGLSENNLIAIQTGRGIEIWDWTDVQNPVQVSKLTISGVNYGDYNNVSWQLFWQAPYLYIARGNGGLTIVDTSDTQNPFVVKTIPTSQLGGFNVGPVFAVGNEMFISSFEGKSGFSILDISDPINPVLEKNIGSLPHKYYASCWDGKYAAFGARAARDPLIIYDTTTTPMTLVSNQLKGFVNLYCNFQDDKLLLGNQQDINVVDLSNISNLSVVGSASLNATGRDVDHGQVFPFGNLIWVGNDHGSGSGLIARSTNADNIAPSINHTFPADLAVDLPASTRIGIAFSDSILMDSVNNQTFTVRKSGSDTPLSGRYSVNLGFVHFSPSSKLDDNSMYVVSVEGIEDFAGNASAAHTFRFSTGSTAGHVISKTIERSAQPQEVLSMSASAASLFGSTVEYAWDFGDGTSTGFSASSNAMHVYPETGHYNVIVTVREAGLYSTSIQQVTIHNALTATAPAHTSTIVNDGSRVFAVNEDNDTVSALDSSAPFAKVWESTVDDRPRTLTLVNGNELWIAQQGSGTVKVLSTRNGSVLDTLQLGRGTQPVGILATPDGNSVLISLKATGELVKFSTSNRQELGRIYLGPDIRAIAIDSQSNTAYVNRFVSAQDHAAVYKVDIASFTLSQDIVLSKDITTVDGPDRARGIFNYLSGIAIAPDGMSAWVTANKANVDRGPFLEGSVENKLTFETTIRAATTQIDLTTSTELVANRLDIDNRAQPTAIEFSGLGDYVYIAMEGQNAIEIRDAYSRNRSGELANTGMAPRGLTKVGTTLFVHNFLSRDVAVFDVSEFENGAGMTTQLASIDLVDDEVMHPRALAGKQIFYNAGDDRMSADGYISCASCHAGGESDNRVWDSTDGGEGLRNTISLIGRSGTGLGNVHWTANFDEIHDFENAIRYGFGGRGFLSDALFAQVSDPLGPAKAGLSNPLDNLAFYVSGLNEFPASPYRNANGTLTIDAEIGRELFASKGCSDCHSGDFYTDRLRHDVGTIQPSSGLGMFEQLDGIGFKTPSLLGVFSTAPYFHNGQAESLYDVLQTGPQHLVSNSTERAHLVAYLEQIEYERDSSSEYVYLSDLTELSSTNGWGPIEKDMSNGERGAGDGRTLSLGGTLFPKGLGVHANSEVVYDISDQDYDWFEAFVGLDDEVSSGRVQFEVYIDGTLSYQSRVLNASDVAEPVFVDIPLGSTILKLVVLDGGNGINHDHADWADAKLRVSDTKNPDLSLPGLYYGELSGAINTVDPNPNSSVSTSLSETETAIATNTTKVFTGFIYDSDGNISFQENIDDYARIWIDGNLVLSDDNWSTSTFTPNLQLTPGWRAIEIRIGNGNGPGGAAGGIGIAFDPNGGTNWQHLEDDGSGALLRTQPEVNTETFDFISDLNETSSSNGWGPIEKDRSNGERGSTDGNTLTIDGHMYQKGLGVHAASSVVYNFSAGEYDQFVAVIGVDDEVGSKGSVIFSVLIDGLEVFSSGTVRGSDSGVQVNVDISSTATSLALKVTDAGDGNHHDHANWADAKLRHSW